MKLKSIFLISLLLIFFSVYLVAQDTGEKTPEKPDTDTSITEKKDADIKTDKEKGTDETAEKKDEEPVAKKETDDKAADKKDAEEGDEDKFYPDYETDEDIKEVHIKKNFFTTMPQYGGWISPVLIVDHKGESLSLISLITTLKLWGKMYLWDNSYLYLRGKYVLMGMLGQKGYNLDKVDNLVDLDVAFIGMAFFHQSLRFFVGRKFFILGSGLVFNGRGDGAELGFYSSYINLKIFSAYTGLLLADNNPYGLSDRDIAEGSERLFTGGTISTEYSNQTFYLLGLVQQDFGEESSDEKTRYQSQYLGLGARGVLFGDFSYYAEFIYETGKSYLTGTDDQENISAIAAVVGMNYYLDMPLKPGLVLQYAYGSGDKDRNDYKDPTGNSSENDTGFIGFGTYVGGFALRPVLANIHVIRAGFFISPCSLLEINFLKRMTIITKYSAYIKDKPEAGINRGEAMEPERFIGHGLDLALRWKIFYDLSAYVNYAFFIPGSAFGSSESTRNFFMLGLNLSF